MLDLIGSVLDDKYLIEEPLGQGGMGSVFLATHVGTQRPVAVKVIAPQFMQQSEFVERFKREAEAAGRLRHPNVVNVTDFGFTTVQARPLAYLVMEYLDGCSLAEVLAEEGKLPLEWVTDIIEQVCSAVEEAHQRGIIHRDLKPDNIWLEPNRRGGYTVKVLDFGLAKIGGQSSPPPISSVSASLPNYLVANENDPVDTDETDTQVQVIQNSEPNEERTNILTPNHIAESSSITRAGTILGTPLYMSPEQCLGQELSPRSDIYSIGVIAYQMLSGTTPFKGDLSSLIKQHAEEVPLPLKSINKKIPRQISELVMSALSKNPDNRPNSAASFASAFRARAEGVVALLRQGVSFYSEHFPTFFKLSLISFIPALIPATTMFIAELLLAADSIPSKIFGGMISLSSTLFAILVAKAINQYMFVPATAQLLLAPLREVSIRKILRQLRQDLLPLVKTSIRVHLYSAAWGMLLIVPGFIAYMSYIFYIPILILEGKSGHAAMQRSWELVKRIRRVVVPLFITSLLIMGISTHLFITLTSILLAPIFSIFFTLAYIRARQIEGETLNEIMARFAEEEVPASKWQQKIREKTKRLSIRYATGYRKETVRQSNQSLTV
ncbi:MAG: protein kinase [Acidobacteriota bacterium]|nr:protein kinase [Blastocatellia bacterium]MDW8412771.1 protein kinase [Acidobacteriota bacterium]